MQKLTKITLLNIIAALTIQSCIDQKSNVESLKTEVTSPKENVIELDKENIEVKQEKIADSIQEYLDVSESEMTSQQDDCNFDITNQTDDFIKEIPEFSNYIWNDSTKTAHITLENGEKLLATRGGCNHFSVFGKWIQNDRKHSKEEVDYWLEQAKWISKRIMSDINYNHLIQMIDEKSYDVNFHENRLYIPFTNHDNSEWYLIVEWILENEKNNVVVETGYYFD